MHRVFEALLPFFRCGVENVSDVCHVAFVGTRDFVRACVRACMPARMRVHELVRGASAWRGRVARASVVP